MRKFVFGAALAACFSAASLPVPAQPVPGSLDVQWNAGAADCSANPQPPLQVHRYEAQTFILRENPCATAEAPFLYLLVGSTTALLVDTGDVADPATMPLAKTVRSLLPGGATGTMPLIVVHTHGHLDHRVGDAQFEGLRNVRLIGSDLASVRSWFGFADWPNGVAEVDLGDRTVDVIPTPGHHPSHVAFHDRRTGLFLSGDFLLPGRLLVNDIDAYRASAIRVADFVKDRTVSHVLGAHVELDVDGQPLPWGSSHHPRERALQLARTDLIALPAALDGFNGFYARRGIFVIINPIHNLEALASAAILLLAGCAWWLWRFLRRRKIRKQRLPA